MANVYRMEEATEKDLKEIQAALKVWPELGSPLAFWREEIYGWAPNDPRRKVVIIDFAGRRMLERNLQDPRWESRTTEDSVEWGLSTYMNLRT